MVRASARHLISSRGVYDIQDGLLDDDGSVYERGGAEYLSTAAFGSNLRFIWDGRLGPGQRTVISHVSEFGVLDATETPVQLGGSGMTLPKRAVEVGGVLFIGGGTLYGGSRKAASYSTGTVSVTQGSKTVTGAGTTWNTLVDAGMLFRISGRVYPVASIDSTTSLTLRDAYEGSTAAGQAYTLHNIYVSAPPYNAQDLYAVAAGRLFVLERNKAYFTPPDSPHSFAATDFHELPEGAESVGGAGLGSRLLWFTTNGLWTVDGLDFDIVDPFAGNQQHSVRHTNPELVLVNHEGIAAWQGKLVAPCADGVWLVDGISAPQRVSTQIDPLWRDYVEAGYRAGLAAVYGSHYFLPVINDTGVVQDQLVCRLDRVIQTGEGLVRPWTRLQGYGANVVAWAVRTGGIQAARNPQLLGASRSNARVTKNNAFFSKSAATKNDADGTTPKLTIITRDYALADGYREGTVKDVAARYELVDAASDNPTVTAEYEIADGGWVALSGTGPEDAGQGRKRWKVRRKARHIRYRFVVAAPNAKMVFRSLEQRARPSQRS